MGFKQFVVVFGGFGLLLGGMGAVPVAIARRSEIVPPLLMLGLGLGLSLALGVYRAVELRYSEPARGRLAAQTQIASSLKWRKTRIVVPILLGMLPLVARALGASLVAELALSLPLVAVVAVEMRRRSSRTPKTTNPTSPSSPPPRR